MKMTYIKMAGILAAGVLLVSGCRSQDYQPSGSDSGNEGMKETVLPVDGSAEISIPASMAAVSTSAVNAELKTEPAITFEERNEPVYATTTVNIRAAATTSSLAVSKLPQGGKITRTGYSTEWSRVDYNGTACYIASRYLSSEPVSVPETTSSSQLSADTQAKEVRLDSSWKYAEFAKITSGAAILYRSEAVNRKGITVCVNAGHGTSGGASVKTLCHPDGTPKVTGGTTGAGATTAVAVSSGMTFQDGTPEAKVTLAMAKVLKEKLLARGYDVLMIRETDDVQLDNVARSVIANNVADCQVAVHWDSTATDKGAYYMSVPNVASYRQMEPVASNWQKHNAFGDSLIAGLKGAGVKIWSGGSMEMDLTQTSYSTVPSVAIELGDKTSDYSAAALDKLGNGLADGIDQYFK